ncbi:MAG TPA: alpha-ketoglutarate-dependent dioxygenase AlkB [Candidatus Rubrimentiphilum sp.]|nr:alpha-ketoglutarate-dependent dioxygenase AlkB [Candidatus Rubrimentiphilum sp.]
MLEACVQQLGLFGSVPAVFVDDETGKIAYYPALLAPDESRRLFDRLANTLSWTQETMWMYDHTVTVPRLIARFDQSQARPAELANLQDRVEKFLGERFNTVSLQYYRDHNDSVAWHSDHTEELIENATVAIVSLGAARDMLIRSKARPRRTIARTLEPGSLFVMGGRAQDFWEHHIPKLRQPLGPRISVALRQKAL